MTNSYQARTTLKSGDINYEIFNINKLGAERVARLPYSLKILLENLLRFEDGVNVTRQDIEALLNWDPKAQPSYEISFTPARVIMQDFTGVPCVVDLAAMREAITRLGGDADKVNPLAPAELVIDHSVQVDEYGTAQALADNNRIEFGRNGERYAFLRWGQTAFRNFKVVPPNTGIVHQVNLEYLGRVVFDNEAGRAGKARQAYPDTVVGTDSHTTMINGLGVLGWGVGGIEAEAAMLGQPVTMLIPQVIGFKLNGSLPPGATATDLVLTVTEILRKQGVVDKFVEFFGDGLANLPLADRATIGNMSPEFGSTCAIFPIDEETIRYLKLSGRPAEQVALVEAYARALGLWRVNAAAPAQYTAVLELDLASVEPSLAGPSRPQDRVPLRVAKSTYRTHLARMSAERAKHNPAASGKAGVSGPPAYEVADGAVLIAAITSCTNTSNPYVMIAAGLVARNARRRGLNSRPWVKTSLAPGSRVVSDYLSSAGLLEELAGVGFDLVGFGCTTCIGNSGPLKPEISAAVKAGDVIGCAVLSGNRNFDGRVHPEVKMNFLASPPLVVAYALAGTLDLDLNTEALGTGSDGRPVYLKDIWPSSQEIADCVHKNISSEMFRRSYASVFKGDERWQAIKVPAGKIYAWDQQSTYVKNPPYFDGMTMQPAAVGEIRGARALALLGDSVTTDHISPAGNIAKSSPAAKYLMAQGVQPVDFNQYGARRGNHEVMMRGTFANIRLKNLLLPGTEGGVTVHIPSGMQLSIFDAAMRYQAEKTPLIILAGKEYGTGSSRDWAAKGTMLLGVRAVIAESFERIHRSNLIGMGVLPLQFKDGQSAQSLKLSGHERFEIQGLAGGSAKTVTVVATPDSGAAIRFEVRVRIDTPKERDYFQHGGILHYVLRQLAGPSKAA